MGTSRGKPVSGDDLRRIPLGQGFAAGRGGYELFPRGAPGNAGPETLRVALSDESQSALDSIAQSLVRENWDSFANNSIEFKYYLGVSAGNPSGNTNNVEFIEYLSGTTVIFAKRFTYDLSDNVTSITAL